MGCKGIKVNVIAREIPKIINDLEKQIALLLKDYGMKITKANLKDHTLNVKKIHITLMNLSAYNHSVLIGKNTKYEKAAISGFVLPQYGREKIMQQDIMFKDTVSSENGDYPRLIHLFVLTFLLSKMGFFVQTENNKFS